MNHCSRFAALVLLTCSLAAAQNEGRLHRDFRVEAQALKNCFHFSCL